MDYVLTWDVMREAPTGWHSHLPVIWREFETAPGVYDFSKLDSWMAKRSDPVHLALVFYMNDLVDLTPTFHKQSHVLTVNGETAEMPGYDNDAWVTAYCNAVEAIIKRYQGNEQVASFWIALGVDQETLAIRDRKGVPFAAAGAQVMTVYQYLDFIDAVLERASSVAGTIPLYAEAAPAPGEPWGKNLRSTMAGMLDQYHIGYKMNGLQIDQPDAMGAPDSTSIGKYDMSMYAPYCAFEPRDEGTNKDPWELYWLLLHAMDWDARFVSLQASWVEHYLDIVDMLPDQNAYWIVFRGAEYPDVQWGVTGDSGNWGHNMYQSGAGDLTYKQDSVGLDRWLLTVGEDGCEIEVGSELEEGTCPARFYIAEDPIGIVAENVELRVNGGKIDIPPGQYHRVDFFYDQFTSPHRTLPSEENQEGIGNITRAMRWYIEEALRQLEATHSTTWMQNSYGAQILYDLVNQKTGLAYRAERLTNGGSDE